VPLRCVARRGSSWNLSRTAFAKSSETWIRLGSADVSSPRHVTEEAVAQDRHHVRHRREPEIAIERLGERRRHSAACRLLETTYFLIEFMTSPNGWSACSGQYAAHSS
jgi:hypothetical protein